MRISLVLLMCLIGLMSCEEKFNSKKWKIREDMVWYPFRDKMLKDIIENEMFIGLKLEQLTDTLGQPNRIIENRVVYSIVTDFGSDIDPVFTKDLIVKFNSDSIVTGLEVKEWNKE